MQARIPYRWLLTGGVAATATAAAVVTVPPLILRRLEGVDVQTVRAPGETLSVDGVRVHYVDRGAGEPIILIHGFAASTFSFRHTLRDLSPRFRVVALDLPGFGLSDRPADADYLLGAQADFVARFMGRLGIERATVVGHSMGGAVALRLAARHPDLVQRLVVIAAPTARLRPPGAGLVRLAQPVFPLVSLLTAHNQRLRECLLRTYYYDPSMVTQEVLQGYALPTRLRGTTPALSRIIPDIVNSEPLDMGRIRQPTLLIWGDHDPVIPLEMGERLRDALPDARLRVVERAGHLIPEERPDAVRDAIVEFVRETSGTGEA